VVERPTRQAAGAQLRRVPWDIVVTAALCAGWGLTAGHDRHLNIDHVTYLSTIHLMRHGVGYFPAMDRALRNSIGPAATPRAFRMATIFYLWRLFLPTDRAIWELLVVSVGVASVGLGRFVRASWVAPFIAAYMLYNAWNKFTLVEMWGVLLVIPAVIAWGHGRRGLAVVLAVAAALVRETTIPLLCGGLVSAIRHRERKWPWLLGLAVCAVAFAANSAAVSPYLVKHGTESPLLGTGRPPWTVFRWMGFGLQLGSLVGPIVWAVAILTLLGLLPPRHKGEERDDPWPPVRGIDDLLLVYLAMPILGFLVQRDYWGVLVVPLTLAIAAGGLQHRVLPRLRRPSPVPEPTG
jgi:hypothetical protein